jgi:hypothetical protein
MDELKYIQQVAEAKAADRRERASRPVPDKIRALVEMQKRIAPILRARGKKAYVWELDDVESND